MKTWERISGPSSTYFFHNKIFGFVVSCFCNVLLLLYVVIFPPQFLFMLVMGHNNPYIPLILDIDECAGLVNPCDAVAHSECMNTNGSYNCQCKDGFVKNGANCEGATHFLSLVWTSSILSYSKFIISGLFATFKNPIYK